MNKPEISLSSRIADLLDFCRTKLLLWALVVFITVLLFEAFHFPF